jgi:acetyl esterase/lipase
MKNLNENALNTSAMETQAWSWGEGVHYERVSGHGRLSLRSSLVSAQLRWLVRPWMSPRAPLRLQRFLTQLLRWTLPSAQGVSMQRMEIAGLRCHRHTPPRLLDPEAGIVYFHGGGYTLCSPDTHRSLTQLIALDTGLEVFVPAYRLAPEHPFPAQLDDAQAFVSALEQHGKDIRKMVFAGDSTGAHLALTAALARRDLGQTLPRSLVLISPCVDWTLRSLPSRSPDALLTPDWVTWTRDGYVDPSLRSLPLVSPIHANLRRLPPILIQSASNELFSRDAKRLYWSLIGAEGLVTWQEWQGLWHDFQLHAALVPEGRDAVRRIARFIRAFI